MKHFLKYSVALLGLGLAATDAHAAGKLNELWYETPAKEWMEAVPLGNGRIGAMVYGGIGHDRIALNEITMWSGQRDTLQNEGCGPERLAEIRRAFFDGNVALGNELTQRYLGINNHSFGTHLPVGDLLIDFDGIDSHVTDYRRSLDLSEAVATTTFTAGDVKYTREYICDYPDNVLAMRVVADRPGAVTATVSTDLLRKSDISTTGGNLVFDGVVDYDMFGPGGVAFSGNILLDADGGKLSRTDSTVTVTGADSFTIYVDIRTDYTTPDYKAEAAANVARAAALGFDKLKANHIADFAPLFSRMSIDLGGNDSRTAAMPTDTRLRLIKNGVTDPAFDALFFQYGRYMQIASSRPASPLCSNLQGIWNDNLACHMAWTCDYHLDININQNYWSANKANLPECNEALFTYLRHLQKYGAYTASDLYGCKGWCAHTVANIWGFTAPAGYVGWALNVTGGAWLATELWSHYLYTLDKDFLRETGYPIMKGCAEFFMDYMVEDPNTGYLVTGPSVSPENGYIYEGNGYPVAMMPTLDRAVVHQIYTACIESAKILGTDRKFRARLEKDIKKLPPLAIGSDGLLKEWLADVRRQDPSHRHSSHLISLYPFAQMSYDTDPELMEASKRSLASQTADPNWENTEWSCGNMLCLYSFLREPEKAHFYLQDLFHNFTRENLMTVSPKGIAGAPEDIFSFDATEASVAGICDMLLQSQNGYIELLPALPSAWKSGSVKGICARGGVEADIEWNDMKPVKATLRSAGGSSFRMRVPEGMKVTLGGNPVKVSADNNGLASFTIKPGENLCFEI